jgi:hypothetical protein
MTNTLCKAKLSERGNLLPLSIKNKTWILGVFEKRQQVAPLRRRPAGAKSIRH